VAGFATVSRDARIGGTAKILDGYWDGSEGVVLSGIWNSPKEYLASLQSNPVALAIRDKNRNSKMRRRRRNPDRLPRSGVDFNIIGEHTIDKAKVLDAAKVYDRASVWDNARVVDYAKVSGNAQVLDNAQVDGAAAVIEDAVVSGHARVGGYALVKGDAEVSGNAVVSGWARVCGDAQLPRNTWLFSGLTPAAAGA